MTFESQDYARWVLKTPKDFESLEYIETPTSLVPGPEEVLIRLHAASLNPRDLAVVHGIGKDSIPHEVKSNLIPGSDGAGTVVQIGSNVKSFAPGDKVVTHIGLQLSDNQMPNIMHMEKGLGQGVDGTLRRMGLFHHRALLHMPKHLSFEEAATLTCSALTAWNALFAGPQAPVKPGDYVLVQGTGGLSIAALQLALAADAIVIATTSSEEKATLLKNIGAKHVVNYRTTPAWGKVVRNLTPEGRGVDHVVDIGGYDTLAESMNAVRTGGLISTVGASGGFDGENVDILEVLFRGITIRGAVVGNRSMFEEMIRFLEEKGVKPLLDSVVFDLKDAKDAYTRLKEKKHFSKIVIKM